MRVRRMHQNSFLFMFRWGAVLCRVHCMPEWSDNQSTSSWIVSVSNQTTEKNCLSVRVLRETIPLIRRSELRKLDTAIHLGVSQKSRGCLGSKMTIDWCQTPNQNWFTAPAANESKPSVTMVARIIKQGSLVWLQLRLIDGKPLWGPRERVKNHKSK